MNYASFEMLKNEFNQDVYTDWAGWCNENGGYCIDDTGDKYVTKKLPEPQALTYAEKRAAEYPSIGEQLDMQYWDKVNNTNNWSEAIAAVKAKYPKNESDTNSSNSVSNV